MWGKFDKENENSRNFVLIFRDCKFFSEDNFGINCIFVSISSSFNNWVNLKNQSSTWWMGLELESKNKRVVSLEIDVGKDSNLLWERESRVKLENPKKKSSQNREIRLFSKNRDFK
eukprot:TRINITY_DN2470_c0_g1_i25.p4 TRINITY_DN2470_c0_g1~~TRINITY_DN2470_c0_g1_i25.p4  ORF type:complete len:116 (-),score=27.81 TRINITY_DN2470_c0_g1_i25:778-1125(-)